MDIKDELNLIKEKTGVTARHLSALCDVTEGTIWNWLRGVHKVPAEKMDIIRGFFSDFEKNAAIDPCGSYDEMPGCGVCNRGG